MKFKPMNKKYFTLTILFSMILFGCQKYDLTKPRGELGPRYRTSCLGISRSFQYEECMSEVLVDEVQGQF
jgi:hypothetical protein